MFGAVFEIPCVYLWLVAEQSMYVLYHSCVCLICLCSNLLSLLVSMMRVELDSTGLEIIICGMLRLRPMGFSKAREKLRGVADISVECLGYILIEMSCLVASSKALDLRRLRGEKFEYKWRHRVVFGRRGNVNGMMPQS